MVKLGWRNPRPNDFQAGDQRPLKDLFGNLQHFMTWPHAGVTPSGAVDATLADKTLTALNAPWSLNTYNLVRNNTIQVPRDFDTWMAVGVVGGVLDNVGSGSYTFGWRINATTGPWLASEHTALVTDPRFVVPIMVPVQKGSTLSIAASAPAALSSILAGAEAYVFFLPLA